MEVPPPITMFRYNSDYNSDSQRFNESNIISGSEYAFLLPIKGELFKKSIELVLK